MSSRSGTVASDGRPLVRVFLLETVRNRVTLSLLVVVPLIFVALIGGSIADAGKLLGGSGGPQAQSATAGWSAGFVAAIAMYFQVRSARAVDRRLVLAGLHPVRLTGARMANGAVLALVVSATSFLALVIRTGIDHPLRVAIGTLMFSAIYLAIGATVGALVATPMNGTVVLLFVWMVDVVFGPAFRPADTVISRFFPTHFVSLWMMALPSHHGGSPGDLGWALAWTVVAVAVSWIVVSSTSRITTRRRLTPSALVGQLVASTRLGLRGVGRNRVLWVLLVLVPGLLVALAAVTTPAVYEKMSVPTAEGPISVRPWFPDVHPGLMAPIAIAALAAIVGLFTILDAQSADRRLVLAGFSSRALLTSRLAVIGIMTLLAVTASLVVAAIFFDARQWPLYIVANMLVGLTYGLIGVLIGRAFGRVGGLFVAFLVPFLDLAIEQSPMLNPTVSTLGHLLPGYGASRLLYTAALTNAPAETTPMLIAFGWLLALGLVTVALLSYGRSAAPPSSNRW